MKVSEYIFSFLRSKGIAQCYLLPGGGAMHLVDAAGRSGIPYVCFQHEQAAAIAAEAYGQHTNRPALLLVTSGPGVTNAITGVAAGWIDSTPMIVLSGQAKRSDLIGESEVRQAGSQEVKTMELVKPITKYAAEITDPFKIRYHLEKAFYESVTGRPGPVWLSVPLDVQGAQIEEGALTGYTKKQGSAPDYQAAARVCLDLLVQSRKPLFLIGNGVKLAGGEPSLFRLLSQLPIPVQTTWKTIDLMEEKHPLYVGHPGIMGDRGANWILQEADLLVAVGSRLDTSLTAFDEANFAKNARHVIVDIDRHELQRMKVSSELSFAGDAAEFLNTLCAEAELTPPSSTCTATWNAWLRYGKALRDSYPVVTKKHRNTGYGVSAYHFIDCLCEELTGDDIIVPESSGGAGEITYQAFRIKCGQKMKNAAGLGSMGFGIPYAIGACLANDRKRTILINGDGAFQLNIQELETVKRLKLPVKMFIWCNGGYASIRAMQKNNFGNYVASGTSSGYSVPDVSLVAQAYGIPTFEIKERHKLASHLRTVLETEGPCLCKVQVPDDETVSPRVKAFVQPDGSIKSGALEDMWPRL